MLRPMGDTRSIVIDVYPWAEPTDEQRRMFDALSPEEQRRAIRKAIEEGFASGVSSKTIAEIIAEANTELDNEP